MNSHGKRNKHQIKKYFSFVFSFRSNYIGFNLHLLKTPFTVKFKTGFKNILSNFFKPEFEDIFAKKKKAVQSFKEEEDKFSDDDDHFIHNHSNNNSNKSFNKKNNDYKKKINNVKWNNHEILERKTIQDPKVTSF